MSIKCPHDIVGASNEARMENSCDEGDGDIQDGARTVSLKKRYKREMGSTIKGPTYEYGAPN
jgi:hypothetical protein